MNNEEILRAVQVEPKKTGEYEQKIAQNGITLSLGIGVLMCAAMILTEIFIFKKIDFGKPAIIIVIASICDLYEGFKTKAKKLMFKGIVEAIIAILAILLYIGALFI